MRDFLKLILLLFIFVDQKAFALDTLSEIEDSRDVHASALFDAFISPNLNIRKRAALACGRIQKVECINPLESLLNDSDLTVLGETIFALGQYGWSPAFTQGRENEIAQQLSSFLTHKNKLIKIRTIEALGKIGLLNTPHILEKTLHDTDSQILNETLLALYRYRLVLRLRGQSTIPDLSTTLIDRIIQLSKQKETETYVAFWLSKVKDLRAFDTLKTLGLSKNPITRLYVLSALSKYPEKSNELSFLIKENLTHKLSQIRIAALQSALSLQLFDDIPDLKDDPSISVRSLYAQSIALNTASIDEKEKILVELYENNALSVKTEALKVLAQLKPENTSSLISENLESNNWLLRNAATQASVYLSTLEQNRILKKSLEDIDVRVRTTALELFAVQNNPEAFLAIQKALSSDELSERGTAVSLLANSTEANREKLAWDCYQLSSGEKWIELREELARLLSTINSNESTDLLIKMTNDPSLSVFNIVVQALRDRQIQDSFTAPIEIMSRSPYLDLKFKKNPFIFLRTRKGDITIELYAKEAPIHTANLYGYVKDKKYDGLPIHRVVYNFVVQGGDPDKTGWGSAGYSLRAEINKKRFLYGTLGMPRSTGFDTGGIQFFITHIPTPHLDGQYTVFGKIVKGMDIVNSLEVGDLIEKAWVND